MTFRKKSRCSPASEQGCSGPGSVEPRETLVDKQALSEATVTEVICPVGMPVMRLDRILKDALLGVSWGSVRSLIRQGKVSIDSTSCTDEGRMIGANEVVRVDPRAQRAPSFRLAGVHIAYWDSQVVVVNKPSGMSTVPFDPSEKDTLDEATRRIISKITGQRCPPLGIVHRIDKETSGLVVFARTTVAKRHLKQQFRFHTNQRVYLALANGTVQSKRIESRLIADRGDGRRGSTTHSQLGQQAITHVEALERFPEATLLRCKLETGRTHQIRIHLGELGHPLLGERVYVSRGHRDATPAPRLMLHAAELGFLHPTRNEGMLFRAEPPPDFQHVLDRLRSGAK